MDRNFIEEFTLKFDLVSLEKDSLLGIYYNESDDRVNFIKANKEGVLLFALILLKLFSKFDDKSKLESDNQIHTFDFNGWDIKESELLIDYIEVLNYKRAEKPIFKNNSIDFKIQVKDKIIGIVFICIFIILVLSLFTGFITLYQWLF